MKKYTLLMVLISYISFAEAQIKSENIKSKYRLISKTKINGFDYWIYLKDINTDIAEANVKPKNTGEPEVVTANKKLLDYGYNTTGEEYVLYRINNKGKKQLELIFPKTIRNEEKKISEEGSYVISGANLTINFKRFDYHFPSKQAIFYHVNKTGYLLFDKRKSENFDTDNLSDDYIRRAKEFTIKSN